MLEVFSTALEFIGDATRVGNSIAALFNSAASMSHAAKEFLNSFKRSARAKVSDIGVLEFREIPSSNIGEVRNLRGTLVPIMAFKGEEESSYRAVSAKISSEISARGPRTPLNSFQTINSREWLMYGCSLQSTDDRRVQVLSLVGDEEVNGVPLLVTQRTLKRLNSERLPYGLNATATGLSISLDAQIVRGMLEKERMAFLRASGHEKVIIADEEILNDFGLDASFAPDLSYNEKDCFFLGYIWASYMNIETMDIVPIYEYGNLGDRESFDILLEKLVHQISFFKRSIWLDLDRQPQERAYKLLLSYNDKVHARIREAFDEDNYFQEREELLARCRSSILHAGA